MSRHDDHVRSLTCSLLAGLVMAAELSSTVEPLTHVATLPGHKFMDFVGQFKGHRKFTKSDMYTPRPEPPNYQPPT